MSLFSIIGLYETLVLQGSYRGVPFSYDREPNDDEAGRRTLAFMFPGQDITVFQDLGQYDGDIVVKGIISGDDYAAQITRLRAAFQLAAPATLINPWLGTIQVVQSPGRFPKFTLNSAELRIAKFTATFRRYKPPATVPPDALQSLLNSLTNMRAAANLMLASILAPVALTLSAVSQVEALAGQAASILATLILAVANPLVGIAGGLPIGLLSSIGSQPLDDTFAGAVGSLLTAPSSAIAETTTPAMPSAVAPGGSTTTPVPVDGRITARLLLSAVTQIGTAPLTTTPIQIPPGPALIACDQMLMLADAISAASAIDFDSQQEATTWRDTIAAAIDALTTAGALLVSSSPTAGAGMWRAMIAARAAWMIQMNTTIGALPPVVTFTPPGQAPVWVLAQYLVGDDPTEIVVTYRDLIKRNGIVHPAIPPVGPLEVLA